MTLIIIRNRICATTLKISDPPGASKLNELEIFIDSKAIIAILATKSMHLTCIFFVAQLPWYRSTMQGGKRVVNRVFFTQQ